MLSMRLLVAFRKKKGAVTVTWMFYILQWRSCLAIDRMNTVGACGSGSIVERIEVLTCTAAFTP